MGTQAPGVGGQVGILSLTPGHGCPLGRAAFPGSSPSSLGCGIGVYPHRKPRCSASSFGNPLCHGRILLAEHQQEGSRFSECARGAGYHQLHRVPSCLTSLLSGWEELDARAWPRVFPALAIAIPGRPAVAPSLRGSSFPSSPFGMLFNSTSASCILASWHTACFYFSWICLDDEAC